MLCLLFQSGCTAPPDRWWGGAGTQFRRRREEPPPMNQAFAPTGQGSPALARRCRIERHWRQRNRHLSCTRSLARESRLLQSGRTCAALKHVIQSAMTVGSSLLGTCSIEGSSVPAGGWGCLSQLIGRPVNSEWTRGKRQKCRPSPTVWSFSCVNPGTSCLIRSTKGQPIIRPDTVLSNSVLSPWESANGCRHVPRLHLAA